MMWRTDPEIYPVIHERGYVEGNVQVISRRAFCLLELIRKYGFDKVRAEIRRPRHHLALFGE